MADPRLYQIAVLASLLLYGMTRLDFDTTPLKVGALLATVLATQAACDRWTAYRSRRAPFAWGSVNVRSALISGLSLCLLLRSNDVWLLFLAAVVTIASKFVLRVRGKHLFNPTNGGIVPMLLVTSHVWVSPGQGGPAAFFAFLMACLGPLVVFR